MACSSTVQSKIDSKQSSYQLIDSTALTRGKDNKPELSYFLSRLKI